MISDKTYKMDKILNIWKWGHSKFFEHIAKSNLVEINSRGMMRDHDIKARLGLHQIAVVGNFDSILYAVNHNLVF